ncbi:MAG: hypothetical protein AAB533_01915 [Patescibacteria group bacterium]
MPTITLPKRIKDAEELIAIPRKEYDDLLLLKKNLQESADFKKELDAWDTLSDEALRDMRDGRGRKIRV